MARLVTVLGLFCSSTWASAAAQSVEGMRIEVTGIGADRWSARADAVRQALQQAVRQLVIADRVVSGDSVALDLVQSTLNGYVQRFEVLGEEEDRGGVVMRAAVWVSEALIAPFIATALVRPGAVRGDEMLARVSAARDGMTQRAAILSRLFAGFPEHAVELDVDSVVPIGDEARVYVTSSISREFLEFVQSGMGALKPCGRIPNVDPYFHPLGHKWVQLKIWSGYSGRFLGARPNPRAEVVCVDSVGPAFTLAPPFVFRNGGRQVRVVAWTEKTFEFVDIAFHGDPPWFYSEMVNQVSRIIEFNPPMSGEFRVPLRFFEGATKLIVRYPSSRLFEACFSPRRIVGECSKELITLLTARATGTERL